jgi:hypothetical protein
MAVIQGMNAYVTENVANSLIGTNAFQVRRVPIQLGLFDDEAYKRVARRPVITRALPHTGCLLQKRFLLTHAGFSLYSRSPPLSDAASARSIAAQSDRAIRSPGCEHAPQMRRGTVRPPRTGPPSHRRTPRSARKKLALDIPRWLLNYQHR